MPHCYGCKGEFGPDAAPSACLPGLCEACERRCRFARERLQRLDARQYGAAHFNTPGVDPPVWRPEKPCPRCGVVGQVYAWTHWRFAGDSTSDAPPHGVEGDGYQFCVNCEAVTVSAWSQPPKPSAPSPMLPPEPLVTTGRSILLGELVFLFILSVTLAALLF
ncbi:MAG: hypothetical protein HY763_02675 [Planctomycetes bacterium]|nr:hypothetical protein [Planctomycetota bacterium]